MIQINDPIKTQIRSGSDLDLILSNQDHIRINDRILDLVWILYGSTDPTRIHDLGLIQINDPIRTQIRSGSDPIQSGSY